MRQKGFIGKVYNIVKYIMQLIGYYKDFVENQLNTYIKDKLFNYIELLLIKDGGVQQNSTYFMLRRILVLCKAINKYLLIQRKLANNSYDLMQDLLTNNNWKQVKQLVKILKPFILATKRIKGNANSPSIKGLYSALQELITNIELLY